MEQFYSIHCRYSIIKLIIQEKLMLVQPNKIITKKTNGLVLLFLKLKSRAVRKFAKVIHLVYSPCTLLNKVIKLQNRGERG